MLKRVTSREKLKYDNVYAVDTLQPDVKAPRDGGRSVAGSKDSKEGDTTNRPVLFLEGVRPRGR